MRANIFRIETRAGNSRTGRCRTPIRHGLGRRFGPWRPPRVEADHARYDMVVKAGADHADRHAAPCDHRGNTWRASDRPAAMATGRPGCRRRSINTGHPGRPQWTRAMVYGGGDPRRGDYGDGSGRIAPRTRLHHRPGPPGSVHRTRGLGRGIRWYKGDTGFTNLLYLSILHTNSALLADR